MVVDEIPNGCDIAIDFAGGRYYFDGTDFTNHHLDRFVSAISSTIAAI